jgi:hypothetical protein
VLLGDAGGGRLHAALNGNGAGVATSSGGSVLIRRAAGAHFDLVKPTQSMIPRQYSLSFLMRAARSAGVPSTGGVAERREPRGHIGHAQDLGDLPRKLLSAIAVGVLGGSTIASHSTFS